jgi:hypothetical protein
MRNEEYPRCNFKYCNYHVDGYCMSEEHRKDCLEIAIGVLCLEGDEDANETKAVRECRM